VWRAAVGGAAVVVAARLIHAPILWVEEAYPAAAAIQILHGQVPYRDFYFDKPPLSPLLYLLWGAWPGWPMRIAGAIFVLLCAWLAFVGASRCWTRRAGWFAAGLTAFFLTFDFPAAAIALSPDVLMVAPHLAVFALAAGGYAFAAGVVAGVALLIHTKGLFVLVLALLWLPRRASAIAAGFLVPTAAAAVILGSLGALEPMWQQVWVWGQAYADDTFVARPIREGLLRTASWALFHATLVVACIPVVRRDWRFAAWIFLSLTAVTLGLRFFPRYYFQLLPPLVIGASGVLPFLRRRHVALLLALLAIPGVRFAPRYVSLALHGDSAWSDTALNRESRTVAGVVNRHARPADTILVWGYRPDILVYTRLKIGAPYLDSQPLTGVLADRHLTSSRPTFDGSAERRKLGGTRPTFVVDGLGTLNPQLAIPRYPELQDWFDQYHQLAPGVWRTK
jgi:hypothetical protein